MFYTAGDAEGLWMTALYLHSIQRWKIDCVDVEKSLSSTSRQETPESSSCEQDGNDGKSTESSSDDPKSYGK